MDFNRQISIDNLDGINELLVELRQTPENKAISWLKYFRKYFRLVLTWLFI